jgi:hypothetical protein
MTPFITTTLLACLIVSAPAFAGGARPPRTPSSEERNDKSFTVDAQPLTLFTGGVGEGFTQGFSTGMFWEPNTILRATVRGGKSCLGARCAYIERSAALTAQKFVGNSFFVEAGAMAQRNIYHPVDNNYFSGDKRAYHFTYNAETWGGTFAIGNQWQWRGFTLGFRWISIYTPLFSASSSVHADAPERYSIEKSEEDQLEALESETKVYFASLAVGASF